MNAKQLQALKLVNCGNSGTGLLHIAQTLISCQAKSLLDLGLIAYAPQRRAVGYALTLAGVEALKNAVPEQTIY